MTQAYERLLVGHVLAGRYEVGEVIGRGGMSVVYHGVDRTLGRPVAVKVVSLPSVSDEMRANLRERFRREAGSAACIPHHPNVVQVYDYGTDPELDLDFIVMELLVGRDLKEALAAGGLPPQQGIRLLREAARGLAAGHRVGIVHRDVKPANLFLVGEGNVESVRVLDFGIAKPLDADPEADLTRTGHFAYSPAYASPEQLRRERAFTPASDVYQLGLIGYELLAGERPFDEAERLRIRAGERLEVPVRGRWSHAPSALRAVLERALRAEPEERYADAGELAEALAADDVDWDETVVEAPVLVATAAAVPPRVVEAPPVEEPAVARERVRPAEPPPAHGVPVGVSGAGRRHAAPALWTRLAAVPPVGWV
ncbi:MAG TPA: serine/threonine-protein kinase, partial [Longimicrobiaceae bacterium]